MDDTQSWITAIGVAVIAVVALLTWIGRPRP